MKLTSRLAQRAGVAAIAAGAIAIPGIALAAPASSAAPAAPAIASHCVVNQLRVWGAPGGAAAGTSYYELELSNVWPRPCTLFGFPGVSALGSSGRQLGAAAVRDYADQTHLITLWQGDTAHALIEIGSVGNYSPATCAPANAVGFRVYPPNDYGSQVVSFPFQACLNRAVTILHTRTTVRGTGIPGFST